MLCLLIKSAQYDEREMESILFGEPTEEEKRELFQELEKNEDMKREFAEMQNIVGLSGLLPREDDSLKGERNLEAMMNRQEKKLRRKRVLQIVRYTTSAAAMIALSGCSPGICLLARRLLLIRRLQFRKGNGYI